MNKKSIPLYPITNSGGANLDVLFSDSATLRFSVCQSRIKRTKSFEKIEKVPELGSKKEDQASHPNHRLATTETYQSNDDTKFFSGLPNQKSNFVRLP